MKLSRAKKELLMFVGLVAVSAVFVFAMSWAMNWQAHSAEIPCADNHKIDQQLAAVRAMDPKSVIQKFNKADTEKILKVLEDVGAAVPMAEQIVGAGVAVNVSAGQAVIGWFASNGCVLVVGKTSAENWKKVVEKALKPKGEETF